MGGWTRSGVEEGEEHHRDERHLVGNRVRLARGKNLILDVYLDISTQIT